MILGGCSSHDFVQSLVLKLCVDNMVEKCGRNRELGTDTERYFCIFELPRSRAGFNRFMGAPDFTGVKLVIIAQTSFGIVKISMAFGVETRR